MTSEGGHDGPMTASLAAAEEGASEGVPVQQLTEAERATRRARFQPRQSNIWTRKSQAVCVRRAFKKYGTKSQPHVVLDGLNMTVPKGTIYGLLGASGCGKTTLLSCIVGRRRLNAGEIWVLGGKPGSRGSGVPGPRIGYMPQDISLYGEFTIRETMIYFGWIAGLTVRQSEENLEFLLKFLELPTSSRQVKNLSGGQQRRVSFAAALLHDPELLILDEPTVGVDPVLRQNIWDHLVNITKDGQKTIIITTHYIEETRQAGMIGLMRSGKFLAEESPTNLMNMHGCDTLEDVFLKLSKEQNRCLRRRSTFMREVLGPEPAFEDPAPDDVNAEISGEYGDNISLSNRSIRIEPDARPQPDIPPEEDMPMNLLDYLKILSPNRMRALIWKNFLWIWRNMGVLMFVILLPWMQIILFCLSVGKDPKGLHLAVVNNDLNNTMDSCPVRGVGCDQSALSCQYLDYLKNKSIILDPFNDRDTAIDAVHRGDVWGVITFGSNYSDSLVQRIDLGRYVDPSVIDNAEVNFYMDMSNQHIGYLLQRDFYGAYEKFAHDMLEACGDNPLYAKMPIRYEKPVYGSMVPNFTDFSAPGIILTIIFFLAVAATSGAMLIERNEGMLERMLVSGITAPEILFSHLTTQFCLMLGQTIMVLLAAFCVFNVTCEGNYGWVSLLTVLNGLCGMCYGFVVSCVVENERNATYLSLGSFLPMIMLCGIIWPVQGMNKFLQAVTLVMPLTKSTESMRAMMARGWSIDNPVVYLGFISTLSWIIIFLTSSILILKFKKG